MYGGVSIWHSQDQTANGARSNLLDASALFTKLQLGYELIRVRTFRGMRIRWRTRGQACEQCAAAECAARLYWHVAAWNEYAHAINWGDLARADPAHPPTHPHHMIPRRGVHTLGPPPPLRIPPFEENWPRYAGRPAAWQCGGGRSQSPHGMNRVAHDLSHRLYRRYKSRAADRPRDQRLACLGALKIEPVGLRERALWVMTTVS
jgi:hypothetical protein